MTDPKGNMKQPTAAPTAAAPPTVIMTSADYARQEAVKVMQDAAAAHLDEFDEADVRDIGHGYRGAGRYLLADQKTLVDANGNVITDKGA